MFEILVIKQNTTTNTNLTLVTNKILNMNPFMRTRNMQLSVRGKQNTLEHHSQSIFSSSTLMGLRKLSLKLGPHR